MSRAKRRLTASPSPVPVRAAPGATCTNGAKTSSRRSGAMPMPVSSTSTETDARPSPSSVTLARTVMPPAGVNFMALPTRLMSTCRTLPASSSSRSRSRPGPTTRSASFFSEAR